VGNLEYSGRIKKAGEFIRGENWGGVMRHEVPSVYDLLYLLTIPGIGPGRIRRLLQVFENVGEINKAPVQRLVQVEGIDYKMAELLKKGGNEETAREQLALITEHSVQYVTIWEASYPSLLKRISDPPVILFYRGDISEQRNRTIAVVGSRTPSAYGKVVCADIVRQLVAQEITIVSGMARGIDSIAHHTALQSGGETLAVLGCGIDCCYPPENRRLFDEITRHGAVMSEYFLGTGPDAINFPKRNRIITGLSLGTLVVEAGDRSGAIISALFSLNQNREVFAIPGNINNPQSRGTNRLIKQGAKLVQNVEDILNEISDLRTMTSLVPKPVPENLGLLERRILENLSSDPVHIDRLVMDLKESPSAVLSGLLMLELFGLVQQLAGKMFVRL
jgi:DNA processing protein